MVDARESVGQSLTFLGKRLEPLISKTLRPHLGSLPWTAILTELDRARGKTPKQFARTDLQAQLRVLTERLGQFNYPFDNSSRTVSIVGNELRIVRNRWAHFDEFDSLDVWRTCDFVVRLLKGLGDDAGVAEAVEQRDQALRVLAEESGVMTTAPASFDEPPVTESKPDFEMVVPDAFVLERQDACDTPTIGSERAEFEPWQVVPVGGIDVLDALPRKVAKEKVRAVAVEIAEFEGPISLSRLAKLTAASFGLGKLHADREKKLSYQIRQTGLVVDDDKFVWPSDVDRSEWAEFRPNPSSVDRPFVEISPIEIANCMTFVRAEQPDLDQTGLERTTLQAFGRMRRTKQVVAHLAKALKYVES